MHQSSFLSLGGLLSSLGHLATTSFWLLYWLDDSNSNRLLHVTHCKATKRWVGRKRLNTHWLAGNKVDNSSISWLDHLGVIFNLLTCSAINFFIEFSKLAGNMSCVAIQHRRVSSMNFTRMIQNNNLQKVTKRSIKALLLTKGQGRKPSKALNYHTSHKNIYSSPNDVFKIVHGLMNIHFKTDSRFFRISLVLHS